MTYAEAYFWHVFVIAMPFILCWAIDHARRDMASPLRPLRKERSCKS